MISYDFWPNVGGVASHVYHLSRALKQIGHDITVLTIRYDRRTPFIEQTDCGTVIRFLVPRVRKVRAILFCILGSIYVAKREYSFDIVHWHNFMPDSVISYSARSNAKVFTNHTSRFIELVKSGKSLHRLRWCVAKAKAIIGPSRELAELSAEWLGKPAYYIPNGVDAQYYTPLDDRRRMRIKEEILGRLGLSVDKYIILCPRRLEPKNGVEYLIRAMLRIRYEHPDAVVLVVGSDADPRYARKVRSMVRDLGLDRWVIFVGPVHPQEMVTFYHTSDVVVVPSVLEAVSIAGLEAMACGLPVIASNVGGLPEIVLHGKTGFLFKKGDSEEMAQYVCRLLDDKELRNTLGENARKHVEEKFTWESVAKETLNLYKKLLHISEKWW